MYESHTHIFIRSEVVGLWMNIETDGALLVPDLDTLLELRERDYPLCFVIGGSAVIPEALHSSVVCACNEGYTGGCLPIDHHADSGLRRYVDPLVQRLGVGSQLRYFLHCSRGVFWTRA